MGLSNECQIQIMHCKQTYSQDLASRQKGWNSAQVPCLFHTNVLRAYLMYPLAMTGIPKHRLISSITQSDKLVGFIAVALADLAHSNSSTHKYSQPACSVISTS